MAIAHIKTIGRLGINCFPITIEVDVSHGLPSFMIVGLPDMIVQESKERIRAAIKNSGAEFPLARITINLAPADIKKEGIGFDLPMAVGILVASGQVKPPSDHVYFFGELGLQGELKPTRGALSFALHASKASVAYLPAANAYEVGLVAGDNTMYGIASLGELMKTLAQQQTAEPITFEPTIEPTEPANEYDFADIYGQHAAKRALEIAAAGNHNILLSGPPGSGKTMLARAFSSILPPLTRAELLETTQLFSIAGLLTSQKPVVTARPFRAPHHSASMVSLVGGGNPPRPGEITLCHNGVLFLDEFAELPRGVIEALRQPLEDKTITVTRAGVSAEFPANCLLIAAINPCPCGFKDDPLHTCTCSAAQLMLYKKKLSGPILDRIDLHVVVPAVPVNELGNQHNAESSKIIRDRVMAARQKQIERYDNLAVTTNSQLPGKDVLTYCTLDTQAQNLLTQAVIKLKLSARSYHKVLKIARTIADLAGDETISPSYLAEALQYRSSQLD